MTADLRRMQIAVFGVLVGCLAACGSEPAPADDGSAGAVDACHGFVETRLEPSAVVFSDESESVEVEDDGSWTIKGEATADSAMGASESHDWTCQVGFNEGSGRYVLENLQGV